MSFKRTFNVCMVEIDWKLSSNDLTPVNHIKDKKMLLEFYYPGFGHCVLMPFSYFSGRGHGGRVVTLSLPTSEAGVRSLSQPQVGKLVVAFCWSAVYSTEP